MFLAIGIICLVIWLANRADRKVDWSGAVRKKLHRDETVKE